MIKLPLVEKIHRTNDFFVERILPDVGKTFVLEGEEVEPFTKIGETKASYFFEKIDPGSTITRDVNSYIEKGLDIAQRRRGILRVNRLYAPYSGFIRKIVDGTYVFEQEKEFFSLLAGAWGKVSGVVENKSVLIKGSATILYCAVCTPFESEGELVVLPNPTELLEDPYFNNFTKEITGKVIYSGHFIKLENLKRAIDLGVSGIIAGGANRTTFDFAQKNGFLLAILSGYGRIPTPESIFELLSSVSNRYVFVRGQSGEILIPSPSKFSDDDIKEKEDYFVELKNDMMVQVLERPYFGWVGNVEAINGEEVSVKLIGGGEKVSVRPTNLLALRF